MRQSIIDWLKRKEDQLYIWEGYERDCFCWNCGRQRIFSKIRLWLTIRADQK